MITDNRAKHNTAKKVHVTVLGLGGGGTNLASNVYKKLQESAKGIMSSENTTFDVYCANTDFTHLKNLDIPEEYKVYCGFDIAEGLGTGYDPVKGKECAEAEAQAFAEIIKQCSLLYLCVTLGGGSGSGFIGVILKIAADLKVPTIVFCTTPFKLEGTPRHTIAYDALGGIYERANSIILTSNQNLLNFVKIEIERAAKEGGGVKPKLTYKECLNKCDDLVADSILTILEMACYAGETNIDFRDMLSILEFKGNAAIAHSSSSGDKRVEKVLQNILTHPLYKSYNFKEAQAIAFDIVSAPDDLDMSEFEQVLERIAELAKNDAVIIYGTREDKEMEPGTIKLSLFLTGMGSDDAATHGQKK